MSAMGLPTLLDVDPNLVNPGWTALFVTVLLALAMVPLFLSMRRQFRKLNTDRNKQTGTADRPRS
jgi:membrane protein insertase Oxa1/YidC/SpoIIIJ